MDNPTKTKTAAALLILLSLSACGGSGANPFADCPPAPSEPAASKSIQPTPPCISSIH